MKTEYSKRSSSRARYKSWAISMLIVYFFVAIVPLGYEILSHTPDQLNESRGIISFKKVGKNILTKLSTSKGEELFTCASGLGRYSECLTHKEMPSLLNKRANVLWYEHSVFPTITTRKLVALYVDGQEIISKERSEKRMARSKSISLWVSLIMTVLIVSIAAFLLKKAKEI